MSKNLKIFLGFLTYSYYLYFLYFIFTGIEISRLNDFSYYKELQSDLDIFISSNIIINLIYFFIFAIIWVALLGFGSPILINFWNIIWTMVGTLISVISISVGALFLYSIGNFFLEIW